MDIQLASRGGDCWLYKWKHDLFDQKLGDHCEMIAGYEDREQWVRDLLSCDDEVQFTQLNQKKRQQEQQALQMLNMHLGGQPVL